MQCYRVVNMDLRFLTVFALLVAGGHGKASVTKSLDGKWTVRDTDNRKYDFVGVFIVKSNSMTSQSNLF